MEIITVRSFDNYFSANIMLTRLQDAGIDCFLKDEFTVTIDPILSNAIGGIKLVVKDTQLQETLELLKEMDDETRKNSQCPKCKNTGLEYIAKTSAGNAFTAIATWMFSSYAIAPAWVYHCNHCGWESPNLPAAE